MTFAEKATRTSPRLLAQCSHQLLTEILASLAAKCAALLNR